MSVVAFLLEKETMMTDIVLVLKNIENPKIWSEPRLNRTGNSAYFEPFLPYT